MHRPPPLTTTTQTHTDAHAISDGGTRPRHGAEPAQQRRRLGERPDILRALGALLEGEEGHCRRRRRGAPARARARVGEGGLPRAWWPVPLSVSVSVSVSVSGAVGGRLGFALGEAHPFRLGLCVCVSRVIGVRVGFIYLFHPPLGPSVWNICVLRG